MTTIKVAPAKLARTVAGIFAKAGSDATIEEAAADKGYHAAATIELAEAIDVRTYIPEPKRPHKSRWVDKLPGLQEAVYANRRRVRRAKGKALQRQGKSAEALATFEALSREQPRWAEARYELGQANAAAGKVDAAIGALRMASMLKCKLCRSA